MSSSKKNASNNVPYEILYGPHPIIECCLAKRRKIQRIYTSKPFPKGWHRIVPHLPRHVSPQIVTKDQLTRLAGTPDHGGVVAFVSPFKFASQIFSPKKKQFILLLDAVQDVRNLGAILRSAYCIGVEGVVLCKKKGAPLTSAVFKASAGLAEHLDIYQAPSIGYALTELQKAGYFLYLAVVEGGKMAHEITYSSPVCLVIGNEEQGISKELLSSGTKISLPQRRTDISYNASVAAGILLFILSSKIATPSLKK